MPDLELSPTPLPGCFLVQPIVRPDSRGYFIKTFVQSILEEAELETRFAEEYHSSSHRGVIRGLHFQRPPHHHAKLVYCVTGAVMDVLVDLRRGSPTFGQAHTFHLSAHNATMLYIPAGLAHGFESLEDNTLMIYKVSSPYAPTHDDGIRWDSVGVVWNSQNPIVSPRDQQFVRLEAFDSPFVFGEI